MNIINHYTGNPMVNNALMTIKALAKVDTVQEITTELLRAMLARPCRECEGSLMDFNLRFKSYTMLFTKNGPLYNDKKLGKQIYETLMYKIVDGFEAEGDRQCNLTGLRYSRSFSDYLLETLITLGVPEKDARKKDLTMNRCWFPLLGGLGSDAQSLPMAIQTYNVHPICVVLLQFLPFSAFIYKKGILLIDSTRLEFCEEFIEERNDVIVEKIKKGISPSEPIENFKGYSKGHYILSALEIMADYRSDFGDADFNLWSFSNSGAGANCSIDRVPNELVNKLVRLHKRHKTELTGILQNVAYSFSFLECLSDNKEWYGLYPAKKYDGVSVEFFESYWKLIGCTRQSELGKYVAGLIAKYKDGKDDSILNKTDAYTLKYDYASVLSRILWKAAQQGEWKMTCQLAMLNEPECLPIHLSTTLWHKMIHFYYQKQAFEDSLPEVEVKNTRASRVCMKMIDLLNNATEGEREKVIRTILSGKYGIYNDVDLSVFDSLLIKYAWQEGICHLYPLLYTVSGKKNVYSVCALLRLYYASDKQENISAWEKEISLGSDDIDTDTRRWLNNINDFVCQYLDYRLQSVIDQSKISILLNKIQRSIPRGDIRTQMIWFYSILERLNESGFGKIWDEKELIYNPSGDYAFSLFLFTFQLGLQSKLQQYVDE